MSYIAMDVCSRFRACTVGPSKIVADSLQHLFVPQVRDGLTLGQLGLSVWDQPNQLAEKQGCGTDGIHHLLISFVRPES